MIPGLPRRVRITEVGPRDGLQNEARAVSTEGKAAFVRALVAAGHRDVEVTSFVRPDRVPQLADAKELFRMLGPSPEGVTWTALVPNERGLDDALEAGVDKVAVFTAASETFNRRNVNTSIEGSLARFAPVAERTKAAGRRLRGYVSVAIACPYEGPIEPTIVRTVVEKLQELGCDEISIGDTIGAATPADVARLLDVVLPVMDVDTAVLHFHDTRGMAVANTMEGLRHGVAGYDASSGGLGGCPFAPGASGNLATEDLIYLLDGLEIAHGVDMQKQRAASTEIAYHVGHPIACRAYQAPPLGRV